MFADLERKLGLSGRIIDRVLLTTDDLRYRRHRIKKKGWFAPNDKSNLDVRTVFIPTDEVRVIQCNIADLIKSRFTAHHIAHAYAAGRSTITNAEKHLGAASLLRVDLVNFFGSIRLSSVTEAIRRVFADFSESDVEAVASLCCYKGFLPQGSPASPILSNLVCWPFDKQLEQLATELDCVVTRYSDDIYFSSKSSFFPQELIKIQRSPARRSLIAGKRLQSLITQFSFEINEDKLRLQLLPHRVQVTGIIVQPKLTIPSEFRRLIRAMLHCWEKHGVTTAASDFHESGDTSKFVNCIGGRIAYVGQVAGKDSLHYQKLAVLFRRLLARDRDAIEA